MMKIVFFLVITILLSIISTTTTQPPPEAAIPADGQEYLDAHNKARAEVGVGPLKWNFQLAKATSLMVRYQRDRQNCRFANLTSGKYGGNQMWATGETVTPRKVVDNWVSEKEFYTYANNSCGRILTSWGVLLLRAFRISLRWLYVSIIRLEMLLVKVRIKLCLCGWLSTFCKKNMFYFYWLVYV